jgi:hypothetical protein
VGVTVIMFIKKFVLHAVLVNPKGLEDIIGKTKKS